MIGTCQRSSARQRRCQIALDGVARPFRSAPGAPPQRPPVAGSSRGELICADRGAPAGREITSPRAQLSQTACLLTPRRERAAPAAVSPPPSAAPSPAPRRLRAASEPREPAGRAAAAVGPGDCERPARTTEWVTAGAAAAAVAAARGCCAWTCWPERLAVAARLQSVPE